METKVINDAKKHIELLKSHRIFDGHSDSFTIELLERLVETLLSKDTKSKQVSDISDDEIISLWRTVSPSGEQDSAMVYQDQDLPYNIDRPTWELRRLVELAMEYGQKK